MKLIWVAAVFGGLLSVSNSASANVVYNFVPGVVTGADGRRDPHLEGVGFTLELKDAAFDAGAFELYGSGAGENGSLFGDVENFVRFRAESSPVTPDYVYGTIRLSLRLSPSGEASGGSVTWFGMDTELDLTISNDSVWGTWGADVANVRGYSESGTLTRTITAIPEPAALALFGVGLVGLLMETRVRRRSR